MFSFDLSDPHLATIAWSRLIEPGDEVAGTLIAQLGAVEALRWLIDRGQPGLEQSRAPFQLARRTLERAAAGWAARLDTLDPVGDMRTITRLGGTVLFPGDAHWPEALADLGAAAPLMLWVLGDLALLTGQPVSLVGSRASTSYGETVAADLASGLVERGFTVVSGGAYGIDAAAHRGGLERTVAVMAGGLDRLYPLGNSALLRAIVDRGAIISELPPGSPPYRQRFLARNRLIAALGRATVVVEAAWRSGALSTASHAERLHRPIGAVPGPVTSMASAGCHQLIRDGIAVCVTDAAEIVELAAPVGQLKESDGSQPRFAQPPDPLDGLDREQRLVYDALSPRAIATVESLTRSAGLGLPTALSALGVLEARGLATQSQTGKWRRVSS